MDLESAISGMDLDGLLQRLKRDGHGAPASGDQAGMELKWNLPPAESLFSSDDEAADTKAEAAAEPRSDGAARIQHSGDGPRGWPEQPSSWSARGRRRSLGPPRGRLAQPTQPRSEPPATVLLDLRAAHDEATGAESPAGHVRDPSEENAISDSSSGDDGLEGFYATRRRHGQWEGASHSRGGTDGREGVSPHRRVLARGRSRAQTGRGATAHPKDSDVEEDTTPRQSRDAHVSLLPAEAEEPAGSSLPTSAVERDMQVFGDHDLCAHQVSCSCLPARCTLGRPLAIGLMQRSTVCTIFLNSAACHPAPVALPQTQMSTCRKQRRADSEHNTSEAGGRP